MMFTIDEFNAKFSVVKNKADGNCLFESIEHSLNFSEYELKHGIHRAKKIRQMVGEFYTKFDRDVDYSDTTIEYMIKMGMLFDNIDNIDDGNISHDSNICNDRVWASMTDVIICSYIFGMNIELYVKENDSITMSKIESQYHFTSTIRLLYSGNNHFEAIDRKC